MPNEKGRFFVRQVVGVSPLNLFCQSAAERASQLLADRDDED